MTREQLKLYTYYIIIGVVSVISCVFLPMLGSQIGVDWQLPDTTVGWIVWIVTKVIIGLINMIIFYCFMQQAKINIKDDPKYTKANEILERIRHTEHKPKGPVRWQVQQYGTKGLMVFVTSMLSVFALTQAILAYDVISLLTYGFTVLMGLIFGIIQMKKAEIYWTEEYYMYALQISKENNNDSDTRQNIPESSGTSTGE